MFKRVSSPIQIGERWRIEYQDESELVSIFVWCMTWEEAHQKINAHYTPTLPDQRRLPTEALKISDWLTNIGVAFLAQDLRYAFNHHDRQFFENWKKQALDYWVKGGICEETDYYREKIKALDLEPMVTQTELCLF